MVNNDGRETRELMQHNEKQNGRYGVEFRMGM